MADSPKVVVEQPVGESIEKIFDLVKEVKKVEVKNTLSTRIRRGLAYLIYPEAKRTTLFMAQLLVQWDIARDDMQIELSRIKRKRDQEKRIHDRVNVILTRLKELTPKGKLRGKIREHDIHLLHGLLYGFSFEVSSVPYASTESTKTSDPWMDELVEAGAAAKTVMWV